MEVDLSRVLDGLPAMVWTAVPDGRIDFVNQRWSDYTGLSLDDAEGWKWQSVIKTDDLAGLLEQWRSILASGQPDEMEARIRRFDGQYRWFLVQTNPIRDDKGQIIKWCGVSIDIDDRKQAEDDLRASECDARQIVDGMPGMVAFFTPGGEVEGVNRKILEYFGKTFEELKYWRTSDSLHPEDLSRCVQIFTNAIASGEPFELECRSRRFDGAYRWFQSRGHPFRDSNGRIVRWYNLLIDIDDRKRAEEALRESEYRLRQIVEAVPVIIWSAAPTGRLTHVNRRLLDYSGMRFEEFMHRGWEEAYMHPADRSDATECYRRAIRTGTPYQAEVRLRRADGEFRWHRTLGEPLRDREGRIIQWYGLSIDIDEAKKAEDQLRRSEALLAKGESASLTGTFVWEFATGNFTWSEELYHIYEIASGSPITFELIATRYHP
jgi:PAS domain S-box-containing protein